MIVRMSLPPNGPGSNFGAPQYGAPQYGAPQFGAPQYGAPQYGAPQFGAPQPGYPQQPGYPPPPMAPNPAAYTPWLDRVLASVVDQLPIWVVLVVGYFVVFVGVGVSASSASHCSTSSYSTSCSAEPSGGAVAFFIIATLVMMIVPFAYSIWNYGYKQGTTGQSIGKKVMKFKVVSERTGQPIGFGASVLRQFAHIADGFLCNIGYLFPLWDPKRQTFADKIMSTVCVPAPPQQPGPQPGQYPAPY